MVAVASTEFLGEVDGIAHRSPVAARDGFAALGEGLAEHGSAAFDSSKERLVLPDAVQQFCGLLQMGEDGRGGVQAAILWTGKSSLPAFRSVR